MKDIIPFADLTPDQQQAFADFQLKEKYRHFPDIDKIDRGLEAIEKRYGIKARTVYIDRWIEI